MTDTYQKDYVWLVSAELWDSENLKSYVHEHATFFNAADANEAAKRWNNKAEADLYEVQCIGLFDQYGYPTRR